MVGSKETAEVVSREPVKVELTFATPHEAETVCSIIEAIAGKQYGSRQIPKGISLEDFVNYKAHVYAVCKQIRAVLEPRLF